MTRLYKVTVTEGQLMLLRVATRNERIKHSVSESKQKRLFELEKALDAAELVRGFPQEHPYSWCAECGRGGSEGHKGGCVNESR